MISNTTPRHLRRWGLIVFTKLLTEFDRPEVIKYDECQPITREREELETEIRTQNNALCLSMCLMMPVVRFGDRELADFDKLHVDVCIEYSDKIRSLLSWAVGVSLMVRCIHMTPGFILTFTI